MKKIKVGIIGQGRSGHNIHVSSLSQMSEMFEIAAVCDVIEERTRDAKENHGAAAYTDYRELLKRDDLDLVVNSSPSHLHVPITREAFEAGRNVLCEKPLARRASEVDELIELAKSKGRFFAVYQQSRFAPYFQQVRRVADSGVLGRVVMIKISFSGFARRWDWQTLQEYNGGNLLNTGPHPLDQALQLFGPDRMPRVHCTMDRATTLGDAERLSKELLGTTAGFNLPRFVCDTPRGGGKRQISGYEHYDREMGVSAWVAPRVKPGKVFYHYDPVNQLPDSGQAIWADRDQRKRRLTEFRRDVKASLSSRSHMTAAMNDVGFGGEYVGQ